jgi:hypothetical protein
MQPHVPIDGYVDLLLDGKMKTTNFGHIQLAHFATDIIG